ncbi:MAG: hypothetical protein ACI3XQ_06530 [Eubacteriales bacterium]
MQVNTSSKLQFVHEHLCPTLKHLISDVESVTYGMFDGEEIAYVIFKDHYITVRVTGCTPRMIADRVIEAVKKEIERWKPKKKAIS